MAALDGVVTVCNTTAHLAGALGVPGLVLAPRGVSWRYQLAGRTLPWYPSLAVLRQRDAGEWTGVLDEAAAAIRAGAPGAIRTERDARSCRTGGARDRRSHRAGGSARARPRSVRARRSRCRGMGLRGGAFRRAPTRRGAARSRKDRAAARGSCGGDVPVRAVDRCRASTAGSERGARASPRRRRSYRGRARCALARRPPVPDLRGGMVRARQAARPLRPAEGRDAVPRARLGCAA